MPDLLAYATKHWETASEHGAVAAGRHATSEATNWLRSRIAAPYYTRRERLIWQDDWDISIVLDATRGDLWAETAPRYQELADVEQDYGWSVGSASPEWYANTFDPAVVPDWGRIGVVTANPFAAKPPERVACLEHTPLDENTAVDHVDYVFNESWGCEVDDEYLDVTHPGVVTEHAWRAWQEWDVDRLVVHYMQPHIPFRSHPDWFGYRENLNHFGEPEVPESLASDDMYAATGNKEVWKELRDGERDYDEVWAAYRDNLHWGVEHALRLVDAVESSTEVLFSSDHGNAIGERGLWSHPPGMQTRALRHVPFVTAAGGGGGTLSSADYTAYDIDSRPISGGQIEGQLAALGYR